MPGILPAREHLGLAQIAHRSRHQLRRVHLQPRHAPVPRAVGARAAPRGLKLGIELLHERRRGAVEIGEVLIQHLLDVLIEVPHQAHGHIDVEDVIHPVRPVVADSPISVDVLKLDHAALDAPGIEREPLLVRPRADAWCAMHTRMPPRQPVVPDVDAVGLLRPGTDLIEIVALGVGLPDVGHVVRAHRDRKVRQQGDIIGHIAVLRIRAAGNDGVGMRLAHFGGHAIDEGPDVVAPLAARIHREIGLRLTLFALALEGPVAGHDGYETPLRVLVEACPEVAHRLVEDFRIAEADPAAGVLVRALPVVLEGEPLRVLITEAFGPVVVGVHADRTAAIAAPAHSAPPLVVLLAGDIRVIRAVVERAAELIARLSAPEDIADLDAVVLRYDEAKLPRPVPADADDTFEELVGGVESAV